MYGLRMRGRQRTGRAKQFIWLPLWQGIGHALDPESQGAPVTRSLKGCGAYGRLVPKRDIDHLVGIKRLNRY